MASIFNTIEVTTGRIHRIINFLESTSEFFIAIGKSTEWESSYGLNITDNNPPFPLEYQKEIIEPILYKRIEIGVGASSIAAAARYKNSCSDFDINAEVLSSNTLIQESPSTKNLLFYSLNELKNAEGMFLQTPEFIYIQGEIKDTEYLVDSWRASALYTKLFFQPNVPNNLPIYTANEVKGGLLHHLTYNSPVLRQVGKNHKFEYIINV